jgi:hypothetical protein
MEAKMASISSRVKYSRTLVLVRFSGIASTRVATPTAYSDDVISTFRRDVNRHSDDVNKVGAQRRWGCIAIMPRDFVSNQVDD